MSLKYLLHFLCHGLTKDNVLCRLTILNCQFRHASTGKKYFPREKSITSQDKIKPKARVKTSIYISDPDSAGTIASYVCDNWKKGYILEANPGSGILSKAMLSNGISNLRVFEVDEDHLKKLEDLTSSHPNLQIIKKDFLHLPTLEYKMNYHAGEEIDQFFHGIEKYAWENGIAFRLFATISDTKGKNFLRFLLPALLKGSSVFSFGRCDFFFLLDELEYKYLMAEPKENLTIYRWSTVLYNLFFDIVYLDKFPAEHFSKSKKTKTDNFYYLVKLTPRPDVYSSLVYDNNLPEFYFFIRHHLAKRTGLVIPTLESWIPSCGPRLIKEGMHVFTRFGDLSPTQLLMLFNQFASWPEYKNSAFHAAFARSNGKDSLSYEEEENS